MSDGSHRRCRSSSPTRWASARNQGRSVSKRSVRICADIARARSLLRRLLLEADALPLVELFEFPYLDRIAVEKPLLTALVLDEPETAVPYQPFDGSVRHVDLRGPYGPARSCIKFRSRSSRNVRRTSVATPPRPSTHLLPARASAPRPRPHS